MLIIWNSQRTIHTVVLWCTSVLRCGNHEQNHLEIQSKDMLLLSLVRLWSYSVSCFPKCLYVELCPWVTLNMRMANKGNGFIKARLVILIQVTGQCPHSNSLLLGFYFPFFHAQKNPLQSTPFQTGGVGTRVCVCKNKSPLLPQK